MNARRDVGELLADRIDFLVEPLPVAQLDAYLKLKGERDEYRRRVYIAAAFVADMYCTCPSVGPAVPSRECEKHYLEAVLAGDE